MRKLHRGLELPTPADQPGGPSVAQKPFDACRLRIAAVSGRRARVTGLGAATGVVRALERAVVGIPGCSSRCSTRSRPCTSPRFACREREPTRRACFWLLSPAPAARTRGGSGRRRPARSQSLIAVTAKLLATRGGVRVQPAPCRTGVCSRPRARVAARRDGARTSQSYDADACSPRARPCRWRCRVRSWSPRREN